MIKVNIELSSKKYEQGRIHKENIFKFWMNRGGKT